MKAGKIVRIAGLVLLAGLLVFGIYTGSKTTPISEKVWDERTTVGSMDAENYFVIYTDLMCPYCIAFENAILENEEEFNDYIEANNVLLEVKISDFLYEYGENRPINSRYGAEAAYCATNEDKFWDYYKAAIHTIWDNYFGSAGKAGFMALNSVDKNFWINIGTEVGLGETFSDCIKNDETLDLIIANTAKTVEAVNGGMPFFKFNRYGVSGFDLSWGWDYVEAYFDKGLLSK